jgi:hypothetical protein
MANTDADPTEIGVVSPPDTAPEIPLDLERLVGRTGPGLFTHQAYRRLVEQPVRLIRDYLASRILQKQQIGTLRFRTRRWQCREGEELARDTWILFHRSLGTAS